MTRVQREEFNIFWCPNTTGHTNMNRLSLNVYHQQKKSYKNDLYSIIAELPQNKTIEGQTGNIYLVRYHSLIRPFTNSELSVKKKKYSWSEMRNGQILSNPFTWRYRSFAETAKWTKPKASRWTKLSKRTKQQHNPSFAHKEETHQWWYTWAQTSHSFHLNLKGSILLCQDVVGWMNPAWIRNLP